MALQGDVWARDSALLYVSSGVVGRVEAGLGRCGAHIQAPAFAPADASNALVQVALASAFAAISVAEVVMLPANRFACGPT